MKRSLVLFLVMVMASLFFSGQSWALTHCDQDTNDLGVCDTFYVETFDCDHVFQITGGFDSVRVAFYVTHDSNTFQEQGSGLWFQDSIAAFVVPLNFWDVGCADSVILPLYGRWNNTKMNQAGWMERSIFRHLVDDHTGDTTYNRFEEWAEVGEVANWTPTVDMEGKAVDGDSGHYFISMIPVAGDAQRWYEGSRVLLFTLTFLIYDLSPDPGCDTSRIKIDTTLWPPTALLEFTRYDAVNYKPRHFLPAVDTIYTGVKWIEGFGEEEGTPATFSVSQNYPNPFNPATNVRFTLPQASHVRIEIFNILGQRVKTIVNEDLKAGVFVADWDGEDERGVEVSSGIYFYRVTAGEFSDLKKMMLLK